MNHELPEHHHGEAVLMAFWRHRKYQAICELGCDVLAWRVKEGRLVFVFCDKERMDAYH